MQKIKNLFKKQKPIAETNEVANKQMLELQRQEEERQCKALRQEYDTTGLETIIKIKDFQIGNGYISFTKTIAPSYYADYDSIDEYEKAINELKSFKNDFVNTTHQAYDIKDFKFFKSDKEYSFYQLFQEGYKNKLYLNETDWNILIGGNKQ